MNRLTMQQGRVATGCFGC